MLSVALDLDGLQAKTVDDVLIISIPFAERSKPGRIDVSTESWSVRPARPAARLVNDESADRGAAMTDTRTHARQCLEEDRIMAVLRQIPAEHLVALADRLVEGGVRSLEITHDYDRAVDDVALLADRYGDRASVGVGTTWTVEQATTAAEAGATFCVLPGIDLETARCSAELGMLTIPGVQTPAEIQLAIRSGADILKFFPADPPGPAWLAQVAPAYRQHPFMATGGVTLDNMAEFFAAGAIAVGMGDALFGRFDDPEGAVDRIAAAVAIAQSSPR